MYKSLGSPFNGGYLDSRSEQREVPLLLVVDDDITTVAVLKNIFGRDHHVVAVSDEMQAISFCQNQLPDLVLLAWIMPELNGHEICRRLKADPLTRYIPVIVLATEPSPDEEVRALNAGAVDFIVHPVGAAVLRARVKTHLMLRRATKRILTFNATPERRMQNGNPEDRRTPA